MRLSQWIGCLLMVATLWLAPDRASAKDNLTIGITQFPSTFHPNIDSMLAKTYVLAMTRRPITIHDPDWQIVCMLCTNLPTIENGGAVPEQTPDGNQGIAVTYQLHPKAAWGDGTPVSADDILFTWEVGKHPQVGVSNLELYRTIRAIDVIDPKTVRFHFDKLTFDYNAINDFGLLPAHLDRAIFDSDPANYKNRTRYDTDTTNPGLYFGPYKITKVERGSYVLLEPNPTWFGKPPQFRQIVVRVIENTAALEANLLSGNVDMIAGELGLSLDQAIAFEKRHRDRYQVLYKPGLVYEHIDLNLDNPLLADARIRKALILAIDRDAISKKLFDGRQPIADSGVNPLDWVHNPNTPHYGFDPNAAKALLDEAGFNRMQSGVRINAEGKPLKLDIMTTAGNRSRELVQQVLQSNWRDVGIQVAIRNEPARVLFGETMRERKFPSMIMYAWMSAPESVPRTTLHSDHIPTKDNNWAGQNYTGYVNPEMDELVERIERELDREKRQALWHRLQEIYATDLPVLPLYFRANAFILPKWLTGIVPTGHQYPTTFWVEHWGAQN